MLSCIEATLPDIETVRTICKVPSVSCGILHHGSILFTKSFGLRDVETNLEANSDTACLIASCSKPIIATALEILVDEEKNFLANKIHTHLLDFDPVGDPSIRGNATIFDALRPSTGLASPDAVFLGPGCRLSVSGEQHLSFVSERASNVKRIRSAFSGLVILQQLCLGVIGHIIKSVSGLKFAEFVRTKVFDPLGMQQSLVSKDEVAKNSNLAHPSTQLEDGRWSQIPNGVTCGNYPAVLVS